MKSVYYLLLVAGSLANLPEIKDGHAFNQARWSELCADSALAALDYRIETDRFGHILMSPPPSFEHSDAIAVEGLRIASQIAALIAHKSLSA